MATFEEGSPGKIALELIESSHEHLELGTNEGDQAFHRLMEEFETNMEESLADCGVNHVASCLTNIHVRVVNEPEGPLAEEIKKSLRDVTKRLCGVDKSLIGVLRRERGPAGRYLAEFVATGSRVCL